MADQTQNSPPTNSDSDASDSKKPGKFFQLAHIYLHYQIVHWYVQSQLQQMQQQGFVSSAKPSVSNSSSGDFLENSLYQASLSGFGQILDLSMAGDNAPQPINYTPPSNQGNPQSSYEFIVLDDSNTASYKHLMHPMFHPHLGALTSRLPKLVLVGVQFQSQPVGYILAVCLPDKSKAFIPFFFVESVHRGKGLGKQLLTRIEQALKRYRCQQVHLSYDTNTTTPVLERILGKRNWLPHRPYSIICSTLIEDVKKAPWLHRYNLPDSVTFFPWVELTTQEREEIKKQRQEILKYPPELDPFREENRIEPINSLGLRYQGQVVGWMITHRISPDTIRYSALFVREDLPKVRCVIPLLAMAINLHTEHPEIPKAKYIVMSDNAAMLRFVERHLVPYKSSINQTWIATKFFNLPPVNPYVSRAVAFN